eukprot:1392523-Amorphochlora_amoeboformis.AAC.1
MLGLSAAILTFAEVNNHSTRLFCALEDMHKTLDTCIPFEPVLSSEEINLLPKSALELTLGEKRKAYGDTAGGIGLEWRKTESCVSNDGPGVAPPEGVYM